MNSANVLAVIPARGGSKGIPKKNIYLLAGKPLIQYSIEPALKAKSLTRLIVSTDSQEIADISKGLNVAVPFLRPESFSTDKALSVDVMRHALEQMEQLDGKRYDYVVMLQPTTPFRTAEDIDQAVTLLISSGCDSVVSMVDVGAYHPARMYEIKEGRLCSVMDEGVTMRPRQELPPIYIRSGDVYACKRDIMLQKNTLMGSDCRATIIPPERAINIDDWRDMALAELYIKGQSL